MEIFFSKNIIVIYLINIIILSVINKCNTNDNDNSNNNSTKKYSIKDFNIIISSPTDTKNLNLITNKQYYISFDLQTRKNSLLKLKPIIIKFDPLKLEENNNNKNNLYLAKIHSTDYVINF